MFLTSTTPPLEGQRTLNSAVQHYSEDKAIIKLRDEMKGEGNKKPQPRKLSNTLSEEDEEGEAGTSGGNK